MSSKPGLTFQPAPRPTPRLSPADAERLREATSDLGFDRTIVPQEGELGPETAHDELAQSAASLLPAAPPKRSSALKFDVPDVVWNALRMEALKRRVTVKYLVMEALADRGYGVDLASIPEDGRRLR